MFIYLAILLFPLAMAWIPAATARRLPAVMGLYFLVLLVFMGLRDEVGPDWTGYLNIFTIATTLPEALHREQLFTYLNILSNNLDWGIYGVCFASAFIFLIGLFSYASKTARPWLSIAVVLPYLGFVIAMSGMRQACAIGIAFFMLAHWKNLSIALKLGLIVVAAGFHTSAAFLVILLLLDSQKSVWLKIMVVGAVTAYMVQAQQNDEFYQSYQTYRANYYDNNLISSGAYFHVALSALPAAIFLLFRKRFVQAGWDNSIVAVGAWGSLAAMPMLIVSSTGVDRLALYFSYVQMWIYPASLVAFKGNSYMVLSLITVLVLMILFVYFLFGIHAESYIPYRNLLIRD
jgi:hypothetical protein